MEKIKDGDNAERYERMIEKRNREIKGFKNEIAKIENIDKTIKETKSLQLKSCKLFVVGAASDVKSEPKAEFSISSKVIVSVPSL